jgi:hypothetical protein
VAKFKALVAPDQLIRVGDETVRFNGGEYETDDATIVAALRANVSVAELETPVETPSETTDGAEGEATETDAPATTDGGKKGKK